MLNLFQSLAAYERTHPMRNYKLDNCGPVYLTVGDGGNIEGPYRNFVDEINPATNLTYCEGLKSGGKTPNAALAANSSWPPYIQSMVQTPSCPTVTFQPAAGINGGPGVVPLNNSKDNLFFCQSSQPIWSAHRDPSFGHALLQVTSDTTLSFSW